MSEYNNMNWFKQAREWGQPNQFSIDLKQDDEYSKKNPDYPYKSRKRHMTEDSPGMGSDTHSTSEQSGQGTNENQSNSLTSFHEIDSKIYEGQIMDEDHTGRPRPRTDDRGGQGSSIGDSPSVLGMEDDGAGNFVLNYTPGDSTTDEVAIKNNLRFQNRPSTRVVSYNGRNVNVMNRR